MMFISVVDVNAAGVSIKNIKLVDHTGNTTEINEPILNGLTINFDLAFGNIGDTATYEVVLNNLKEFAKDGRQITLQPWQAVILC